MVTTWKGKKVIECGRKLTTLNDEVNSPSHYTFGGIETIDYIKAKMSKEEFIGYLRGNLIKYISRAGHKGKAGIDLSKAEWYLKKLIEEVDK